MPTIHDLDLDELLAEEMDRKMAMIPGPDAQRRTMMDDKVPIVDWDSEELLEDFWIRRLARGAQQDDGGCIGILSSFFKSVSLVLAKWSGPLGLEGVVGEMADFMERRQWDCLHLNERVPLPKGTAGIDPPGFPRVYDRIHMSNIPDYVGGSPAVAMQARPVLGEPRPRGCPNVWFNVLLDQMEWRSHDGYESQYMLMRGKGPISSHFSKSVNPAKPIPPDDMLTKAQLEKWFYGRFLKLCLPFPRPGRSMSRLQSPLNFTAFLRLLSHVAELGYPIHWPAGIISVICSGSIMTTARAPRNIKTSGGDIDAVYPARKMSVAPWVEGFNVILSVGARLLPFGLTGLPLTALKLPADIAIYSISFPPFTELDPNRPHFELVFWDFANPNNMGNAIPKRAVSGLAVADDGLRKALLDDEMGDGPAAAKKFRDGGGVHLVSALTYTTRTRTAQFWCSRASVQALQAEGSDWRVFLLRMDAWLRVSDGVKVREGLKLLRGWPE